MHLGSVKHPSEANTILDQSGALRLEAHACYRALVENSNHETSEIGFGGRLLYAGALEGLGCAMMVAGNVAGCATLAVTADEAVQKRAIRDGVADFLVTSLDEALRILKNEIRKHKSVSVCIGTDRGTVEQEMMKRGVLPDLVFADDSTTLPLVSRFGEDVREIRMSKPKPTEAFIKWQVAQSPAQWMPKLDAIALDCLADEPWTQRWIRVSSRYLGRAALAERAFHCEAQAAMRILREFDAAAQEGAIATEVAVNIMDEGESKVFRLRPPAI